MDQKKAGRFLKELRHEKQMTQEQLAQVFNVSSRSVSRWETGTNLPDISLLVEIADFYDVDVYEQLKQIIKESNVAAKLTYTDSIEAASEYGIISKPAIVIDNKVIACNNGIDENGLKEMLVSY